MIYWKHGKEVRYMLEKLMVKVVSQVLWYMVRHL